MIDFKSTLTHLTKVFCNDTPTPTGKLKDKVILITGGGGSIGSQLVVQSIAEGAKRVIALDNTEYNLFKLHQRVKSDVLVSYLGDYGDKDILDDIFDCHRVNLVIHAGAYKHVTLVEENPKSAVKNNIIKAVRLFTELKYHEIPCIVVSTDKACNPRNTMGLSKYIVESCAFRILGDFCKVVRFGNVLGSSGSVVPIFYYQALAGEDITITDFRMERYFMSIEQACYLIIYCNQLQSGVYLLEMGEQIPIYNLAQEIVSFLDSPSKFVEVGACKGEKLREELYAETEEMVKISDDIIKVSPKYELDKRLDSGINLIIDRPYLVPRETIWQLAKLITFKEAVYP